MMPFFFRGMVKIRFSYGPENYFHAMTTLRIIDDTSHDAAFNMAEDRRLLDSCVQHDAVVLRLYSWDPPAVSLGCMQNPEQTLDIKRLSDAGFGWIVRPTGGRAILHHDDLTYCIVFPKRVAAMGSTVAESYAVISRCLQRGCALAGITTQAHDSVLDSREVRRKIKLPCFLAPNRDEIMARGRKLAGSAQKRTALAVLQHGSVPLSGAFRELPEFMRISDSERCAQKRLLERKCACVRDFAPEMSMGRFRECIRRGFVEELGLVLDD
jgi:lipoate-protein ligase A